MAIAVRQAEVVWDGTLAGGDGALSGASGALELLVTWASRTEQPDGKTSPEELIAAAHASCFAMALALVLGEAHTPPERLVVSAACTLDEVDGAPRITTAELAVRARVPALDDHRPSSIVRPSRASSTGASPRSSSQRPAAFAASAVSRASSCPGSWWNRTR